MEVLTQEAILACLEAIDMDLIARAEVVESPQPAVLDMIKGSHR
jgi:hypothetical protein